MRVPTPGAGPPPHSRSRCSAAGRSSKCSTRKPSPASSPAIAPVAGRDGGRLDPWPPRPRHGRCRTTSGASGATLRPAMRSRIATRQPASSPRGCRYRARVMSTPPSRPPARPSPAGARSRRRNGPGLYWLSRRTHSASAGLAGWSPPIWGDAGRRRRRGPPWHQSVESAAGFRTCSRARRWRFATAST